MTSVMAVYFRRPVTGPAMALALASGWAVFAQSPAPERREPTASIEFFAVGPDQVPARDLKLSDVTVRLDSRPRTVKSLKLVTMAVPVPADAAGAAAAAPPPFGSNSDEGLGRSFIVVVDEESIRIGRERPMRAALKRFVSSLAPHDRISVVTVPYGGLKIDFTTNHLKVQEIIAGLTGRAPNPESIQAGSCRTRNVLQSIDGLLSSLAGGEGPTSVLFVSASLYGPRRDAPVGAAPGMCEIAVRDFQLVGAAAARARAHFLVVKSDDQPSPGQLVATEFNTAGSDHPLVGFEHLAGVTGGREMLLLSSAGDGAFLPLLQETSAYYEAVIALTDADLDGVPHSLDVKVAREGITVRARPQLFLPKPDPMVLPPPTRSPQEMIRDTRVFRTLPLRVAGYASAAAAGRIRILVAVEPIEANVTLKALAAGVFDEQGRLTGQGSALPGELTTTPVLMALDVAPGTYRLRAAAVDAAGRSGAADVTITAEVAPAGPLKLSSLVLGVSRSGVPFLPRLQFSNEPVALGYLEIYGGAAGTQVMAIIEVATTLNGPAFNSTRLALDATSDPTRFTATGAIPLGSLPPGDYVVRAIVGSEGKPAGRVVATLRKR
jgi:hypothetical protein